MEIKVVTSISKYNKDINKKIEAGTLDKAETGLVMTPETFNKVFSPERIKLLQRIYKNKIRSIYQLAKELNKPYEVVFRNIQYLAGVGIIEIKKKDNKDVPHLVSTLSIDMFAEEVEA
jgi:predicted transcriptional regulator